MGENYILRNVRLVDPSRGVDTTADIGVQDGLVADPGKVVKPVEFDLRGLVATPGLIDMHVHLRYPGQTAKETISTGTRAAAAGGFTALVAMPNTKPPVDTPGAVEYLRRQASHDGVVKVFPCGCMSKESKGEEMAVIGSLAQAGVVAISDDGECVQNHEIMRHVVEYSKTFNLPILDHCQDEFLTCGGVMHEGKWSVLLGLRGIPSAAEELMVARDIILARMADWKVHIQHVSAKESVELVRQAQAQGLMISAEATPHHICLTDEEIKHFDTNFKVNPPLRAPEDVAAVRRGLRDGTIAVIASDHAPHTETEKLVEFDYSPFGIIGLETTLPVCLTELYHSGELTLPQLVSKFTDGPAGVLGLRLGSLAEGMPADITIIDIEREFTIDKQSFLSKARNTPFHGRQVKGMAAATIVDGVVVFSRLPQMPGKIAAQEEE